MTNFNWYSRKQKYKWLALIILLLLIIFFVWKAIIKSDHLVFYIVCLALWIVLYYCIQFLKKKKISSPASLWRKYSKKYPVIIQYAPPKWINPAEAWLLYNCSVEPTDLTSLIYQWKFENLIDIKIFKWQNSDKEYIKLIKKNDMPCSRPLFESEIFNSIFCMWDVKIIEWAFQLRYALMLEDLEYHCIRKWWVKYRWKKDNEKKIDLNKNNVSIQSIFAIFYIIAWIISVELESLWISTSFWNNISITFSEFIWSFAIIIWIILLIALIYGIIWKTWNLKFTDKWAELASQIIWYSQFIKSCDENKIKLLLKEDPLFIDRTLPYATAFGMETEFLNKVSPLKKDWNAKYVRWKKAHHRIWILRFLMKDDDGSLL